MDDQERHRLRDLVRRAADALGEIIELNAGCPAGVDRFDWSADLLDDLARVALRVGEAAATLAGGEDDDLARHSGELATAIVRRRNDALIPLPTNRRRLRRGTPALDPSRVIARPS